MRTLLVDNYDSYTYNLFQLIAEVNDAEPVVITNDSEYAGDIDWSAFDNIVISPGPGHPGKARDFGICADILRDAEIPVLGVCLGHQGIGYAVGATVAPAPEPRHGYLSRIRHNGEGLFAGLPQDFVAVRYHSLHIEPPLPDRLEPIAWSEDGVIMGVRDRNRPVWGVQFHPESVCTEYGHRLLTNFRDLTHAHRHRTNGRVPDHQPEADFRVHIHKLDEAVDPDSAFTRLYADSAADVYWLDSAHIEPGRSRFSFLGDASGPLSETVRYRVGEPGVTVRRHDRQWQHVPGTIFDYLKSALAARRADAVDVPFGFTGGYVGYFGYELKHLLGSPNRHVSPCPDAMWVFADRFVVVDHEQGATYLVALSDGSAEVADETARWIAATEQVLRAQAEPQPTHASAGTAPEDWLISDRQGYTGRIADIKALLNAGETYEVCLTTAAWLPAAEEGYSFYRRLRRMNPAPYSAYLRMDDIEIASSSPERFLAIDRSRTVETKPIKGTVARGDDPRTDEQLRKSLSSSAKTRAENLMIVDLLRNDLGRVCEVGSVSVPALMATESYATVHQLVSTVRGRMKQDLDAIDVVRACFPGGSMTGAPKLRTMEIIDELETEARGVYSGALGLLSVNGTADLSIVIRTAVRVGDRWRVGAGGAIVLDSDADDEFDEMVLKAAAPLRAFRTATGVRTGQ